MPATILELLNIEAAEIPGESLVACWAADRDPASDAGVLSELHTAIRNPDWPNAEAPMVSLWKDRFHYIHSYGEWPDQLFDVSTDLREEHDLAQTPEGPGGDSAASQRIGERAASGRGGTVDRRTGRVGGVEMVELPETPDEGEDPGAQSVYQYLVYGLSLPERTLRSTSALLGGAIHESAALLVPQAFRSSQAYSTFVQKMLDFMTRDIGGVGSEASDDEPAGVENYVARKTIGNFIELAGLSTMHISPAIVLAIVSDVAYGSQSYLRELSDELKEQGLIDEDTTFDRTADLLSAVQKASATTSEAFDTPPLSVDGLVETIDQTKQAVATLDPTQLMPQAEIERLWQEMHSVAEQQHVSVMDISSTMALLAVGKVGTLGQGALSSVRVAGNMFDRHILEHYSASLAEIEERGFYTTLADASRPYLTALWDNFSVDKPTFTEDALSGRLFTRAWSGMRTWLVPEESPSDES